MERDSSQDRAGGDFVLPCPRDGGIALCAGCSAQGHCRLGLQAERLDCDGTVWTDLVCAAEHAGGPGVAHGGWTAGVLDELVGHVPMLHGTLAVTGTLAVRFLRPVPVGRQLVGSAGIVTKTDGRWHVRARLCLAAGGAELAVADAVMVERDPSHYSRFRAWLDTQE
ncbi:PaaI family thioesterase [Streptomyces sp. NPDC051554]